MKYRVSPFQILCLIFLGFGIKYFFEISQSKSDPGLGGLIPYIFIGFAIGAIVVDFITQLIFQKKRKWFYIFQFTTLMLGTIWVLQASRERTLMITEKRPQYIRIIYGLSSQEELPSILGFSSKTFVPQTGTVLTSTKLASDSKTFDFEWVDGTTIDDNWTLIPLKLTGKYPCENEQVDFRLFFLSNNRSWSRGKGWNESLDMDHETEQQLITICR